MLSNQIKLAPPPRSRFTVLIIISECIKNVNLPKQQKDTEDILVVVGACHVCSQ